MSLPASSSSMNDGPVVEADPGAVYSLETMSQLSGISYAWRMVQRRS